MKMIDIIKMTKTKTTFLVLVIIILLVLIISSCKISTNVVSSNIIQKRKYNNGFFIDIFSKRSKTPISLTKNNSTAKQIINSESQEITSSNSPDLIAATNDIVIIQDTTEKLISKLNSYEEKYFLHKQNKNTKIKADIINKKNNLCLLPFGKSSDDLKVNGMALAGFICGLSAPFLLFLFLIFDSIGFFITLPLLVIFVISFICSICALIFSRRGLKEIKLYPQQFKGKGFAIVGLILGIIGTVFWVLTGLVLLFFWGMLLIM